MRFFLRIALIFQKNLSFIENQEKIKVDDQKIFEMVLLLKQKAERKHLNLKFINEFEKGNEDTDRQGNANTLYLILDGSMYRYFIKFNNEAGKSYLGCELDNKEDRT